MDFMWVGRHQLRLQLIGTPFIVAPSLPLLSLFSFRGASFTVCTQLLVADQLNAMIMCWCICWFLSHLTYIAMADVVFSQSFALSPLKKA
jgi:hypothetical protein